MHSYKIFPERCGIVNCTRLKLFEEFWVRKMVEIWQFKSKLGLISGLKS